jgi:hypothetical protein
MLRAADEFDSDIPIAATYIRKAASQVETVSDANPQKGGHPAPSRVTFLTGAIRDFSNRRRHRL